MKILTLAAYLSIINLLAFIVYGLDKQLAKRGHSRVSERTLLLLAGVGGSIGAYGAMQLFRHKTLHKKFNIGVPLIFLAQAILIGVLVYFGVLKL